MERSGERLPAEWPFLAAIRFLLSIGIANYHLFVVKPPHSVPLLGLLGSQGCICGFLAISGYSIAHSISTQPKGFYRRRALRVLPIYYVAMALSLLPYLVDSDRPWRTEVDPFTTAELVGSLFLLQGFLVGKIPVFGPSWTLSIEWWLYVLAPLFVRMRWWMLAALAAISLFLEDLWMRQGLYPIHMNLWGIPAMMLLWAWVLGFLFYKVRGWTGPALVIVGFLGTARLPESPAAYPVAALALTLARRVPPLTARTARVLNYLGDLSYPLYLVHVPLMFWLGRFTTWSNPYLYLALSLALSAALYHGIDDPLRGRLLARRRSDQARGNAETLQAALGGISVK